LLAWLGHSMATRRNHDASSGLTRRLVGTCRLFGRAYFRTRATHALRKVALLVYTTPSTSMPLRVAGALPAAAGMWRLKQWALV